MRHRNKTKILDRKKGPRELMLRNLASSILIYKKVKTTEAKAKVVRTLVEKMVTIAKKDDLIARRNLLKVLLQKKAIEEAFKLGKKYKDLNGGYTRIIPLGRRQGDGAKMVQIEFV